MSLGLQAKVRTTFAGRNLPTGMLETVGIAVWVAVAALANEVAVYAMARSTSRRKEGVKVFVTAGLAGRLAVEQQTHCSRLGAD
jgi:hypothetical protein